MAENKETKAKEPKAEEKEAKTEVKEQKAEAEQARAEVKEPKAEDKEAKAEAKEPGVRKQGGKKKKKRTQKIPKGVAHIKATFNNTVITIADPEGNVLTSVSSGAVGFKGTKKSTPFAASRAAEDAGKKALAMGMKEISIYVKGPGAGREAAIRSLESVGLSIDIIRDVTPIPHNGCRPPKRRRV